MDPDTQAIATRMIEDKIRATYADARRSQSRDHSPLPEWTELPIELREVMIHLFYADVRHGGGS